MKTNFSAKTAKALRNTANNEGKGFNHCTKAVLTAWANGTKDNELAESIKAAKADGIKRESFCSAFIIENLTGTKWVNGQTIMTNKKGEMVAKTSWTPGAVVDYVRRANKARLEAEKAAKVSK